MGDLGRKPVTLVQIDLPYCSRTYGTAPCTAALSAENPRKCFNSRFTCQDPENYDETTRTVTFAYNQDGNPDIPGLFPALVSVSSRPGEINLSGVDPRSTALGVRARVSVELQDFTNNDTYLDKYQSERVSGAALFSGVGYQPESRGRFLSRLIARFPYYLGLPLRVYRGYAGQAIGDMPVEHYVITEVDGPNASGRMVITAKDVIDLAENEKAVYPSASRGKLLADLTINDTTATLTPEGVGAEYEASGLVRIGREIMAFTRVDDVLTLTRGQEGTAAQTHSAGDVAQECGVLDGLTINQAAETILKYKETAFTTFIDAVEWQAENDTWLAGTTIGRVIIAKPTGKKQLIGELCQLGVLIWWAATGQELRYKVNSPLLPDEEYYPVTDENAIIEGTVEVDRAEDQRISALWIYHGIRDWTDDTLAARNFNKLAIASVDENLYGQEAYKEIFTRWFGREGDDGSASIIAERLLTRYRDVPKVISGQLDVKDRPGVELGARLSVETYVLNDVDGAVIAESMQVNYAEYTGDDRVKFRAETYNVSGRFAFWLDASTAPADYDSATEAQRRAGAFWGDATSPGMPDGTSDYLWF